MRTVEQVDFLKDEMTKHFAETSDQSDLKRPSGLAWSVTDPITEAEWSKWKDRAENRLGPYDLACFGKGLTEYQACLYAFESAAKDGWSFERFTLWPLFGKMTHNKWERKRAVKSVKGDDVPLYYFRLALKH